MTLHRFVVLPLFVGLVGGVALASPGRGVQSEQYDLVLAGGRVLDPETALDATRNVGIQGGRIAEAQLDRFMFELRVAYPSKDEEAAIVEATTGDHAATVAPVLTAEDVLALQHLVRRIPAAKTLVGAAVTLVRMTRPGDVEAPAFIKEFISWGAGPRASQYLVLGAKARAALDGRPMPDYDDLRAVAPTVLTHRLVINFAAEAAGRAAPDIVDELLKDGRWLAP